MQDTPRIALPRKVQELAAQTFLRNLGEGEFIYVEAKDGAVCYFSAYEKDMPLFLGVETPLLYGARVWDRYTQKIEKVKGIKNSLMSEIELEEGVKDNLQARADTVQMPPQFTEHTNSAVTEVIPGLLSDALSKVSSKPVAEQEEFPDYVSALENTDIVDATTGKIDIYALAKRAERIRAKIENNVGKHGLAQYESLLSTDLGKPDDPPLFRHPPLGFSLLKDSARWCDELCELLGRQEIPLAKQAAVIVASEYKLRDDEYIVIFGTGYYVCVRVGNQEEVRFRLRNTEEIDIDVELARISADPALAKAVQNMLVKTIRDAAYRTYRDSGFDSKEQGQ